jgi:hypothetical protein
VRQGSPAGLAVALDGRDKVLRVRAEAGPITALPAPPWDATEFAGEFRLPAGNRYGFALVFGYVDERNHGEVRLDPVAGNIQVVRVANGAETRLVERAASIVPGKWIEFEIQTEGGEIEVNFAGDAVEFSAEIGAGMASSGFGVRVPAGGSVDVRELSLAGEASTPRVSIVSCSGYENGAATTNLLTGSTRPFQPGAGVQLAERTSSWRGANAHGEFEWAVVVRRFADGAVTNEEGDTFEFRLVDAADATAAVSATPALRRRMATCISSWSRRRPTTFS